MGNEAHIRIDEGVKRGSPTYQHPPAVRPQEGPGWTIPPDLNPDDIITAYLTEQTTSGIALRYGLRRAALTRWLQKVRPEEWKEVQVIRALCTKEDGTEQLYDAANALQLARARELRRASEWDLERLDSKNYGPHITQTVEFTGDLGDRLRRSRERVIEGECAVLIPDTAKRTAPSPDLPLIPQVDHDK